MNDPQTSTDSPPPTISSRESSTGDDKAAMRAKCVICDNSLTLITSANIPPHDLRENIEVDVKIRSPSVTRLVDFVEAMIRTGKFNPE